MSPLSEWQTYLAVQAGAAATLTGLVFVAVSINLARILSVPGLPGRAFDALVQLLQVFFIASFVLAPQPAALLATETLLIALASLIGQMVSQYRYARLQPDHPRSWLVSRVLFSVAATLPFCVSGVMLLLNSPAWICGIVLGAFLSFIAAVTGAWVLLIEILR